VNRPLVTALLLAGSRPGVDPLAAHFGVATKALVPLGGEAMLSRVARVLVGHPGIARVIILGQQGEALARHPDTAWLADDPAVSFESGGDSVSAAIAETIGRHPSGYPFFVTTADHALLDAAILDAFLADALASGSDVAFGMVERRTLEARFPGNRRTWLRFRGASYSGANLFLFATPRALRAIDLWRTIEQQRKKARAIVGAFGPLILAGVALRLWSLPQALQKAGRRLGLSAAAIDLPIAEACIDVDKIEDHILAERLLAARA